MSVSSSRSSLSFFSHVRETLVLGFPLVASLVAQMLIGTIDTIMVGWLGASELAAGTLAFQFIFVLLIFGYGLGSAMTTLMSQALGGDRFTHFRWVFRMGLWSLIILSLLFQFPLWFVREILLFFGQEFSIVLLTESYMTYARWSLLPAFIVVGFRSFFISTHRGFDVLLFSIFAVLLNSFLNWLLIFGNLGFPRLEMLGAGLATFLTNCCVVFLCILFLYFRSSILFFDLLGRFFYFRIFSFLSVLRLGVPVGFAIFSESGLFFATSLMMGLLGTIPLAAHGIALQIAGLAFMVPLGLGQAGNVRVSESYGAGDLLSVSYSGYSVLFLGICFALFSVMIFLFFPSFLVSLFIDFSNPFSSLIFDYAVSLIFLAACFQLFDSVQVVVMNSLRGLGDTQVPLYFALFSYWLFGIPLSWVLSFWFGYGGYGVWIGLSSGLALSSILLFFRFYYRESLGLLG